MNKEKLLHFTGSTTYTDIILSWPKTSFRFFHNLLWKNSNFLANPKYLTIV